jgi:hypothetical protein
MTRLGKQFVGVLVVLASLALIANAQAPPDPKQALAQAANDLGICQQQLGALNQMKAQVIIGNLVDLTSVKANFEKAHPDLVLDVQTWATSEKPKPAVIGATGATGTTGKGRGGQQ